MRRPIITQDWLQDFYANQVVKSKYKGSLKNKKIINKKNVKRKR
jgi:hypothetical protein